MSEVDEITLESLNNRLKVLEHQYNGIIKDLLIVKLIKRKTDILEDKVNKVNEIKKH
jgi:hypothetical protein